MDDRLGVIFDMDGVLIDSYHAHFKSWQRICEQSGLAITREQFDATFGRTSRETIAALWKDSRLTEEEILELDRRKEALFREMLRAELPAMPGAVELLQSLYEAGFALGLGSSGPRENVELVLDALGNRGWWGAVVTGSDVTRGKPDPQVFLIAADRLALPPSRCAVVEDAPLGIAAAKQAGMKTIALVSTGRTRQMLAQADMVVESLAEITCSSVRNLILRDQPPASSYAWRSNGLSR